MRYSAKIVKNLLGTGYRVYDSQKRKFVSPQYKSRAAAQALVDQYNKEDQKENRKVMNGIKAIFWIILLGCVYLILKAGGL